MADKMLRIALKGDDGLAKAAKSDNEGNIKVKVENDSVPVNLTSQIAGEDLTRDRLQVGARPQYALTVQSHVNSIVAANGLGNPNGTDPVIYNAYLDLRGYSEFAIIWTTNASHAFDIYLRWGIDSGYSKTYELISVANGTGGINGVPAHSNPTTRIQTKAPYLQISFKNKDTVEHTYNAWVVAQPHS